MLEARSDGKSGLDRGGFHKSKYAEAVVAGGNRIQSSKCLSRSPGSGAITPGKFAVTRAGIEGGV